MAPVLVNELKSRPAIPVVALSPIPDVITLGLVDNRDVFSEIALDRFCHSDDLDSAAQYLGPCLSLMQRQRRLL